MFSLIRSTNIALENGEVWSGNGCRHGYGTDDDIALVGEKRSFVVLDCILNQAAMS